MLPLILALVALILAAITLFTSRGTSLLGWAIVALALIHLLPQLGL